MGLINCFRCSNPLVNADDKNADYILADDTIEEAPMEVWLVFLHTRGSLQKLADGELITDDDLTSRFLTSDEIEALQPQLIEDSHGHRVDIPNVQDVIPNSVKLSTRIMTMPTQRHQIVCPDCYHDDDEIIWGVHKDG